MNNAFHIKQIAGWLFFPAFVFLCGCEKPAIVPTLYVDKVYSGSVSLSSIYFTDAQHGFAGGDDGTLLVTTDGGASWQAATLQAGEDANFNCISFPTRDTGWASGEENSNSINSGPAIYSTYNGGQTWQSAGAASDMRFTHFPTKTVGYRDENTLHIAKTTNGGQSWNTLSASPGTSFNYSALYFVNKDTGFVGTANAEFRTTNGGASWSVMTMPSYELQFSAPSAYAFADNENGVAVFTRGSIDVTNDGGATWHNSFSAYNNDYYPINAVTMPSSQVMLAGGINYLFVSVDGGGSWEQYFQQDGTSFPGEVKAIHFYDDHNGYAVTAEGSIYRLRRGN